MTLLRDVGDLADLEDCQPLHNTRIWNKSVSTIKHIHLRITHKRLSLKYDKVTADAAIKLCIAEVQKEQILGQLEEAPLATYRLPEQPMLLSEVLNLLSEFSQAEKRAIIFAMATDMHIRQVILMKRADLDEKYQPFVANLLRSVPPHIQCQYVFWKFTREGAASPLMGLESRFMDRTKLTWSRFVELTDNLILYLAPDKQELASALL